MDPAIVCDNLGKRFRVTRSGGPAGMWSYRSLREDLAGLVTAPLRLLRGRAPVPTDEDFWALRDVCFEIQPGEVVGVIGPNGAGKSTLLKVLSRITRPTTGQVELAGRVGSLLEVGTGFHPELTGRENVFLNGAILGMRRHEIARKFDQIVEFAEIGPFLDMPVKRYSSGMYVRLAFAVAAHLEPEILIVDEVLAVGDLAFQRKCLGRMREVGRGGATVLFVSHHMPAVETLCTRALLLDGGRVVRDGPVAELVRAYHQRVLGTQAGGAVPLAERTGPGRSFRIFQSAALLDADGAPTSLVPLGSPFRLRLALRTDRPITYPSVTLAIDDTLGHTLLNVCTPLSRPVFERVDGHLEVECKIPAFPLAPGDYWIKLTLSTVDEEVDEIDRALHFTVTDGEAFGEGRGYYRGVCVAPSHWQVVGEAS